MSLSEVPHEVMDISDQRFRKKLIENRSSYYVAVSHAELDNLIGSLMHLCDLNSDSVYREALKSEIKMRSRRWLDDEYSYAGYKDYAVQPGAQIINIEAIEKSLAK